MPMPKDALAIMVGKLAPKKGDKDDADVAKEEQMEKLLKAIEKKDPKEMARCLDKFIMCGPPEDDEDEDSDKEY